MSNSHIGDVCRLFCCPPCPSSIVSKVAFKPQDPTYRLCHKKSNGKYRIHMTDYAEWEYSDKEKEAIEVFHTSTIRGNKIACMFIKCSPNAKFCILFSHGNATDIGNMSTFYFELGTRLNCNIFSYDYSGYGLSTGKPSEKNLYADINAAYDALRDNYIISTKKIILYGQSLGTVPTIDLASRYKVGAVVLHSAFMSGLRLMFNVRKTSLFDVFPSIDKVSNITSPVLVIHGINDEMVDFSHALAIYEKCSTAVEPLWVEGAGHHDVQLHKSYFERLEHFISVELVCCQHASVGSLYNATPTEV